VLVYDTRGNGQSGGSYPGESPTASTIAVLARDAAAAARFVAAQPEVDPARVGLAGHSQAGWIMPLAATRERAIRFLVSFSGPSVTADEVDLFQSLTGEGERHAATIAEAERQVLARGPSGVDPMPWIRMLTIPSLWVYGALDQQVPAGLSSQLLEPLAGDGARDVTVQVYPRANHALVETQTGLTSEMLRSDTFAPGLFAAVGGWLRAHRLGG
jgi:dienelactone hydrolase